MRTGTMSAHCFKSSNSDILPIYSGATSTNTRVQKSLKQQFKEVQWTKCINTRILAVLRIWNVNSFDKRKTVNKFEKNATSTTYLVYLVRQSMEDCFLYHSLHIFRHISKHVNCIIFDDKSCKLSQVCRQYVPFAWAARKNIQNVEYKSWISSFRGQGLHGCTMILPGRIPQSL